MRLQSKPFISKVGVYCRFFHLTNVSILHKLRHFLCAGAATLENKGLSATELNVYRARRLFNVILLKAIETAHGKSRWS